MERPVVTLSPQFALHTESEVRPCAALIVDIAGTVGLRSRLGDAVAGARIRKLLEDIVAASRAHGGEFIKSYGDDVLAIFERDAVASAARVAILAQRLARQAGLQLYAGFHAGDVEFRQTMGHPDALGLTVNIAARLHKLTEGAPGRIFAAESSAQALPPELRAVAARYGTRELKGIGPLEIWTLEWQETGPGEQTLFHQTITPLTHGRAAVQDAVLLLRHHAGHLRLEAAPGTWVIGRGIDAALRVPDPEPRVSSQHLQLEYAAGRWFAHDISRNGTWLRDGRTHEEAALPKGRPYALPSCGELCLGRPFAADTEGLFTVRFETAKPE